MKRAKVSRVSRPPAESTNGSATSSGAWVIEMRPADSERPPAERSTSKTASSHELFEQTYHHLRGFLDRMYR